jgi:hypothetical protein
METSKLAISAEQLTEAVRRYSNLYEFHAHEFQAYTWSGPFLQIHQYPEDEDRAGPWNVGFFVA